MRARLMGTVAEVIVPGDTDLEQYAIDRLRTLEARWSRFVDDSEISLINRSAGAPTQISEETSRLLAAALLACQRSDGRFDPTIHDAITAAGYDRTFEAIETSSTATPRPHPAPGCAGIELTDRWITVPPGTRLDVGGIAKGFAADLIVDEVLRAGAVGACVNVGGDLRVHGLPPTAAGWIIGVNDPFIPEREVLRLALAGGAVATSSRVRRRWSRAGVEMHHLIDPRTGEPVSTPLVAATVVAGTATDAEVMTKLLFVDEGHGAAAVSASDASAIAIYADRSVRCIGDVEAFAA